MTSQITGRTATSRRTLWRWAADTAWAHASTGRTVPIRTTIVRITSRQQLAALHANPNMHQVSPVHTSTNPATGQQTHTVRVRYSDTAHPVRNPRAAKARRVAARIVRAAVAVGVLAGTGATINAVWGDQIAAAIHIIITAGATLLGLLVAVLFARSISVGHPCPGLHCPNCGGH